MDRDTIHAIPGLSRRAAWGENALSVEVVIANRAGAQPIIADESRWTWVDAGLTVPLLSLLALAGTVDLVPNLVGLTSDTAVAVPV